MGAYRQEKQLALHPMQSTPNSPPAGSVAEGVSVDVAVAAAVPDDDTLAVLEAVELGVAVMVGDTIDAMLSDAEKMPWPVVAGPKVLMRSTLSPLYRR